MFASLVFLWRCATNNTGRPLTTRLVFLNRSQRPQHPDLLVTTSSASYNHIVRPDRFCSKPALQTHLPRQEVLNVLWKHCHQQPPICRLLLFVLRKFCTTFIFSYQISKWLRMELFLQPKARLAISPYLTVNFIHGKQRFKVGYTKGDITKNCYCIVKAKLSSTIHVDESIYYRRNRFEECFHSYISSSFQIC